MGDTLQPTGVGEGVLLTSRLSITPVMSRVFGAVMADVMNHRAVCTGRDCRTCLDRKRSAAEYELERHAELFSFYCSMERACLALPETAAMAGEWAARAASEEHYILDAERALA